MYRQSITQITDDTMRLCRDFRGSMTNGKHWSWEEIRHYVERAILELAVKTGILKNIQSIKISENVYIYDMPVDCIRLLRASVNGLAGHVVTPKSIGSYDYELSPHNQQGEPYNFFRNLLKPNQIGFIPGPATTGSDFNRDNLYGLLRRITDQDGNQLDFDANLAMRDIRTLDVSMLRSSDGNIIREILMPDGNIQVTYVRLPNIPDNPNEYLEADIPEYIHKDIKYGACLKPLSQMIDTFAAQKRRYFQVKWNSVLSNLMTYSEHKGNLNEMRPA